LKKTLTIIILAILSNTVYAQEYKNQIKGNALFTPVGMINIGYEHAFSQHWTGQADLFVSPWKSFAGRHLQIYMGHLETRYYFSKAMEKWYVGANIGMAVYDMQKWNYWNSSLYQKGFNVMLGATVGYQFKINDHWNLDLYLGGGNSQGFYHGWDGSKSPRERYDDADNWNKSGEWIPYRGGLMVAYKF